MSFPPGYPQKQGWVHYICLGSLWKLSIHILPNLKVSRNAIGFNNHNLSHKTPQQKALLKNSEIIASVHKKKTLQDCKTLPLVNLIRH